MSLIRGGLADALEDGFRLEAAPGKGKPEPRFEPGGASRFYARLAQGAARRGCCACPS